MRFNEIKEDFSRRSQRLCHIYIVRRHKLFYDGINFSPQFSIHSTDGCMQAIARRRNLSGERA